MSWADVLSEIGTGRRQDDRPRFYYVDAPPYYITAYGIAVKHGFVGTEEEWLESLKADMQKEDYDPSSSVEEAGGIPAYVSDAISGKQDTLTFDTTPTQGSANPATSGGIYSAIKSAKTVIIDVDSYTSAASVGAVVTQALTAGRAVVMRYWITNMMTYTYVDLPMIANVAVGVTSRFHFYGHSSSGTAYYAAISATSDAYSWVSRPTAMLVSPAAGTISVSATWTGSASPYTQTVTVVGPTVNGTSKVDIQLTATQIAALQAASVTALSVENNNGTLTLYAFGAKPTEAMTVQCTVQETH